MIFLLKNTFLYGFFRHAKLIFFFVQIIGLFLVILFKMLKKFKEYLIFTNIFLVNLLIWISLKSLLVEMYLLIVKSCFKVRYKLFVECHSKYLGLSAFVGRSKKQVFNFVQDRVWMKIKGWKKILSTTAREVLINKWFKQFLCI